MSASASDPTSVNYGAASPPPAYGDKPPEYSAVTDPEAAPPSYDSLYGEFRSVNDPRGFFEFFRRVTGIIVGTVVAAVLIAIASIIPIAMIVIGSLNIYNCPAERYIPIYLVVGGSFGLFKSITNFYYRMRSKQSDHPTAPEDIVNPNPFDGVLNCFLLAWFIAGSVWVYQAYEPNMENPAKGNYCDGLTYWFTFSLITLTYALMGIFMFFMCCCGCVAICCGRSAPDQ